jgi:hypothetical protein
MAKNNRVVDTKQLQDGMSIEAVQNNPPSGGRKSLTVGPRLLPIPAPAGTWTVTPTTLTPLPKLGLNIAIYNNSGSVGTIVIGGNAITTLTPGQIDSSGNVGVPCPPNAWSYLSMGYNQYVITSASTLLVYIMEDPTWIAQESGPFIPQNAANTQPIS